MSRIGHNSGIIETKELRLLVERVERINEDIADRQDDRKAVFAEAKAQGYDPAMIREVIKARKMDPTTRQERQSLLETYFAAFGIE